MNIGSAIVLVRRRLGMKQHELAERCGISQTSISGIELNKRKPSSRTLKRICAVLEIPESILYILGMEESDVSASKKEIYATVFPSIKRLALQIALTGTMVTDSGD